MYLLIKAVAILYEVVQFLSGIFNHVLVELNSVVHTKWPLGKNTQQEEYCHCITWRWEDIRLYHRRG